MARRLNPREELAKLARRRRIWSLERRAHKAEMKHIAAMKCGDRRAARDAEAALLATSRALLVELR